MTDNFEITKHILYALNNGVDRLDRNNSQIQTTGDGYIFYYLANKVYSIVHPRYAVSITFSISFDKNKIYYTTSGDREATLLNIHVINEE
jgi:hypothetical protein